MRSGLLAAAVFRDRSLHGASVITKEILSEGTNHYQNWVEAFARNRRIPIEWAEKDIRKEDFVRRWQRRMARNNVDVLKATAAQKLESGVVLVFGRRQ